MFPSMRWCAGPSYIALWISNAQLEKVLNEVSFGESIKLIHPVPWSPAIDLLNVIPLDTITHNQKLLHIKTHYKAQNQVIKTRLRRLSTAGVNYYICTIREVYVFHQVFLFDLVFLNTIHELIQQKLFHSAWFNTSFIFELYS